jgi:hypothetical protein
MNTKTNEATEVLFLFNKRNNDLFAFFNQEKRKVLNTDLYMSYSHVGQHSECCYDYAIESKHATKAQYNDLAQELQSIGYNLNILNKQ